MIRSYPYFSALELAHNNQIKSLTKRFEPYSDFNFTSLYAWNVDDTTELSILNNNLVIRMPDYLDSHVVYSILGDNNIDESLNILLEVTDKLELVPEAVIQAIANKASYQLAEDRDNFDYIYSLAQLSELPGGSFKKKRNKVNVFKKAHENYELIIKNTTHLDEAGAERIKQIDQEWAKQASRSQGDIMPERKALARLLENFAEFQASIIEIAVNGEVKAFSINEVLGNHYAICHFEKALTVHHEHIYTFLAREAAQILNEAGCHWVNWEQDLGLESLRRAKLSYYPTKLLKKYTVKLAS